MIINVDFKRRMILDHAVAYKIEQEEPKTQWERIVAGLEARFGDRMPKKGVIYSQSLKTNVFDTYGRGNVSNSLHQYKPTEKADWNNPIPFPCDLPAVEAYLKKNRGRTLRLGNKSDPFMWMDHKYEVTKEVLRIANEFDVKLCIRTISDLCAHEDYLWLIKQGGHAVEMIMSFEEIPPDRLDDQERKLSPGAPSISRRLAAISRLKDAGVDVSQTWFSLKNLNKSKLKEFAKRTGQTADFWIRGAE